MQGVRVVELGFWVAGPCAGGVLADWGADVVKVEPPSGDPFRDYLRMLARSDVNPPFELDNRGKRSMCVDLTTAKGRDVVQDLVATADVFISNLRATALARLGLDHATTAERNPRLVYATLTGYGPDGPDANRATYDVGAFWARAGVAQALLPEGHAPPQQRGGMGDHISGLTLAGGIAAALLARERTGRGQRVSSSLLRVGAYMVSWDVSMKLRLGLPTVPLVREVALNPLFNSYCAADGRWFWLLCAEPDRHWPDVARAIQRPDLMDDERFSSATNRRRHRQAVVAELDSVFAARPLDDWALIFDQEDVWWAPVQSPHELIDDPQASGAGLFVDAIAMDGTETKMPATPVDFLDDLDTGATRPMPPAPMKGQHTAELLAELGYDECLISALTADGVVS